MTAPLHSSVRSAATAGTPGTVSRATKTLLVRTPEGIVFPLQLASPISRFLALMVDAVCISLLCSAVSVVLSVLRQINMDVGGAVVAVACFLVSIGYPMALEWQWQGRTIGKRLLRLQVMDERGLRLRLSQVVLRNLLRFVDQLPFFYGLGGFMALLSPRGQRLGDLAANTIVIHHPKHREPDLSQILPDKYNTFRDYPHLAARLRQRVLPREGGIALEALMRREDFDLDARINLFRELREYLGAYAPFPAEATDGLSDEQYVRNAVDIIFR